MSDYDNIVKEYVRLQEQREYIDQQMDQLKEQLRTLGEGTYDIAGVKVSITPNRRIDAKLVESEYPIGQHPELYKGVPDTAALRRHLSPIRVEQLMTTVGPPKVSVR